MTAIFAATAVAIGILIPFCAQSLAAQAALIAIALIAVFLTARRGEIGMTDFLILFIAMIPFHHFRIGPENVFIRPTELAFIPLALLWVSRAITRAAASGTAPLPREYAILAAFLLMSSFSITQSVEPAVSIYRTAVLTYMIIFSLLALDVLDTEIKLLRVTDALVVIAGISGIWGVLQTFFPQLTPFANVRFPLTAIGSVKIYRASAGWDNPNYFALFLSLAIPVTAALAFSRSFGKKCFYRFFLALQVCGLAATYSRNGAVSAAAGLLFLLWFFKKKIVVLMIILLLILTVCLVWIGKDFIAENMHFLYAYFLRAPMHDVKYSPESILIFRWDAWRANIAMFLDHPLLGVGPFMAGRNYAQYKPLDAAFQAPGLEPHNEYISLLSERGIFGFLLLLTFLFLLIRRGIQTFDNRRAGNLEVLTIGLTASVVSFCVAGLAEAVLTDVTFWLLAGLFFAACRLIREQQNP